MPNTLKADLFLIAGDPFLRAQKIKVITAEIEKKTGSPLSHQNFDLDETSIEAVLSAARTLPFLSQGQVLCVQGAGALKDADLPILSAYLEKPVSQTVLILEADELRGAAELQRLVKAHGQLIVLAKAEARGVGAGYVQQKIGQYHKSMSPGAKARVLAMCGDAVVFLDSILERLVQFAGDQKEIDEDMVGRFEENWAEMDVFKLTNAFVDRDPARALKVFRDLVEFYEEDLFSVVGILHWQLRQLWQAAMLLKSGVPEREICSKLRMPPGRLYSLKKIPVTRLEAAVEALFQIDKKSKTGQLDGVSGVEAWLLEYSS